MNKNRILKRIVTVFLCFIAVVIINSVYSVMAATESELKGPEVVRCGDTITLDLVVAQNNVSDVKGTVKSDSELVVLTGVSAKKKEWVAEKYGNELVFYDNSTSNKVSSGETVASFNFKVDESIKVGTAVKIDFDYVIAGSTYKCSYSFKVEKKLTGNADLVGIAIKDYTFTPEFSKDVTEYSIGTVDYQVSEINITANPSDSDSTIKITGNKLAVGNNKIVIEVTADNGNVKKYFVNVVRKEQPASETGTTSTDVKETEPEMETTETPTTEQVKDTVSSEETEGTVVETTQNEEVTEETSDSETDFEPETTISEQDKDTETENEDETETVGSAVKSSEGSGAPWIVIAVVAVVAVIVIIVIMVYRRRQ